MKSISMTPIIYDYILKHSSKLHPILDELRQYTSTLVGSQMQISEDQGVFLNFLVKILKAKRVLEIGCFTGYSAIAMSLALGSDGNLCTLEIDSEKLGVAKNFFSKAGVSDKISTFLGPALQSLDRIEEAVKSGAQLPFDFVFIDADKANYYNYFNRVQNIIKDDAVVAVDNVLWEGAVCDPNVSDNSTVAIRTFNDFLAQDKRFEICMLGISDGLSLIRRKI